MKVVTIPKTKMSDPVSSVVVVGGGTAGWITASVLAAKLRDRGIEITLVESATVPQMGVGEGTWPTMRQTLKSIGVREADFIRECNVAFKQGWKYERWLTGEDDDFYYHPLELPESHFDDRLIPEWLDDDRGLSFSEAVCPQERICELHLAPKQITTPEYAGIANYAYHLDAGKFSVFLQRHAIEELGVRHVLDDVTAINGSENGDVSSVSTAAHGDLEGDLFVDCTGFKSLLLGKHLGIPFISCKDTLFVDSAIAVHVPYPDDATPIVSPTLATAQSAGWIWDIGLDTRRGLGYVYSSDHVSSELAMEELRTHLERQGADPDALSYRDIKFDPGHRKVFWQRNVVAIGLSSGFVEPLEASSLLLAEVSARTLAERLPANRAIMPLVARQFNETFSYHWGRIIDFLKLHYVLSRRTDSRFWIDNRDPATVPDRLKELLELWRYHIPSNSDLGRASEVYSAASYQFVLYGMGFRTLSMPEISNHTSIQSRKDSFQMIQKKAFAWSQALPGNRELVQKIKRFGLQKV